jgi:uncharacterized surface protein with fasciclin (FAS1) repeats
MKTNIKFILVAIIAFTSFVSTSCSSDDDPAPVVDNTITGKALATPELSLLVKALTKTGLASVLQEAGGYTVFAPTNTAFAEIEKYSTAAKIDALTADETLVLKEILLNHVVSGTTGKKVADLFNDSYIKTLAKGSASSTNTLSMYVDKTDGVTLNGMADAITGKTDIIATNGVVHIIDGVLTLPNIVDHAIANPNFSKLLELTNGQTAVVGVLVGSSANTLFAPINSAVTAATTSGGFAFEASSDAVAKVLKYHVIPGNKLAAELLAITDPISTLNSGETVSIINTSGVKVKGFPVDNLCGIIIQDVQCSNGVIHAIDKVLQPNNL